MLQVKYGSRRSFKLPAVLLYSLPMLLCWLAVLLAYWPGILVSDSMAQWHQVQTGVIDDWHPAYNTLYIKALAAICNSPAFVLAVQVLILALSIGLFLSMLAKHYKIKPLYLFCCSVVLALIPLNYNSAVVLLKDTLYSAFLVLLTAILIDLVNDEKFFSRPAKVCMFSFVILAIALTRHNGIYVDLLAGIVLLIVYRKKWPVYPAVIVPCILYFLMVTVGFNALNICRADYSNKYAPVSHLMARMLNTQEVVFTSEEKEELAEFADVEQLKDTFHPYNMDYSIAVQNVDALKENGSAYVKFALKKITQYPLVFVKHYLVLDSFLYSPWPFPDSGVVGMFTETDLWVYKDIYPSLEEDSKLPALLPVLQKEEELFQSGILGNLTMRPALYVYFTLFVCIIAAGWHKNKKILLLMIPSVGNILSLAPAMPVHMTRYVYSNILLGYLFTAWFIYMVYAKKKKRKPDENTVA